MKDIFDNYIMKRGDVLELYVKKREFMILNPELVAPEEHKITKWTHYLPPVVDFSVIKSIHNVASDFESMFKDDFFGLCALLSCIDTKRDNENICVCV
jgi:hypothetical protein